MKKVFFIFAFALLAIGMVSAQGWGRGWDQGRGGGWGWTSPPAPPTAITVEGTLQLQNGFIVLFTGTTAYHIQGLQRLVGFVDGLQEGARMSVEGFASGNFLRPTKFTVEGREFDLARNTPEWCPFESPMMRNHHRGRGRWR